MAQFDNGDLEYVVDELYDMTGFEDEYYNPFTQNEPETNNGSDPLDSDFEDDFESVQSLVVVVVACIQSLFQMMMMKLSVWFWQSKSKTDTSALEARNGKDIQGIPWERLNFSRDEYRETRLKQYRNYENLSRSREDLDKVYFLCVCVLDFNFQTRTLFFTLVIGFFSEKQKTLILFSCLFKD